MSRYTQEKHDENRKFVLQGCMAPAGTVCPYGMQDLRYRHLWLAGHYDTYGKHAWEKARCAPKNI